MKVLLIRFSSIGDIVLTSPVPRWLSQINDVEVHFLTKAGFTDLVVHSPYIDQVHTLSDDLAQTIAELKLQDFNLIIDLHKNIRSRRISRSLGVKSLRFNKLNLKKWLFVNFKINILPNKHLVDRYADGIKSLALDTEDRSIDFHFPSDFLGDIAKWGLHSGKYICLVIGGTYYTKQIPEETLLVLIKRLNRPVVLLGGGTSDATKAERLIDSADSTQLISLVNKTTLLESAFVIKKSQSLITSDTGLMHIASAFDVPIHTVWGNTDPLFGMYAYRTDRSTLSDYEVELPCHPCSKLGSNSCPRGHFQCMVNQNTDQIVKNCLRIEPRQ